MTNWSELKVVDLRSELKERGLPQTGLKGDLVARLTEADKEVSQEETHTKETPPDDDEPVATAPTPDEPEAKTETTIDDPPEYVAPQTETVEGETAPLATTEAETLAIEEEIQHETTESGVHDHAALPSAPGDEADPKPTNATPANEPVADVEMATDLRKEASPTPQITGNTPDPDTQESQKRKRRSLTPPPTEEAIARKRARIALDETNGITSAVHFPEDQTPSKTEPPSDEMQIDEETQDKPQDLDSHETRGKLDPTHPEPREQPRTDDVERNAVPSVHPATTALYIKNLMRPLRPNDVQTHLIDLATPSSDSIDDSIIVDFFLDQIRTHAFVVFKSISAASRVRNALHDCVWPNESNRKPLWVDFIPPEKVQDWIGTEESRGPRSAARWEVVYEDGPGGEVEAHLESGAASFSRPSNRPPPGPLRNDGDAIPPSIPRGLRDNDGPPRGPRADRPGPENGPRRGGPNTPRGDFRSTQAHPVIHYQLVAEDLARRRVEKMHSHYTTDRDRDLGREINRYSFEDGDTFVDRGKEVFEGIRPPHRERAMERERRGFGGNGPPGGGRRRRGGRGGGGRGGFRPRSDRYLPGQGSGSGRDDRRPRSNDDTDRPPTRFDDDREPPRRRENWDRRY
ncbi:hypothetical protein B0T10DRAFT_211799 [Thelonectria olida]|uniref:SAP domain-containing protein n=1 Tax=Thelonectria olida TaxID=1576542 RepID=A0A9P8WA03_9HYPO|nr:hypothetical protein B0T10DRAFT_211799 [Thelonectria olida]